MCWCLPAPRAALVSELPMQCWALGTALCCECAGPAGLLHCQNASQSDIIFLCHIPFQGALLTRAFVFFFLNSHEVLRDREVKPAMTLGRALSGLPTAFLPFQCQGSSGHQSSYFPAFLSFSLLDWNIDKFSGKRNAGAPNSSVRADGLIWHADRAMPWVWYPHPKSSPSPCDL